MRVLSILGALFLAACICFAYPMDAFLPIPLAVVFGPLLATRLGIPEGPLVLFVCVSLLLPLLWRSNPWTKLAFILSLGIWVWSGVKMGLILHYA
jgi:hypothetical protein